MSQSSPAHEPAVDPTFARDSRGANSTVLAILFAISFGHLLNDMLQALLPSIYPLLKDSFELDFAHIGLLTLTYQATA